MIEVRPRGTGGEGERDPDGVRVVARGKSGGATRIWQGAALLLVSACAGYLLMPSRVASKPNVDVRKLETEQLDQQLAAALEKENAEIKAADGVAPAAPTASTRSLVPRRPPSQRPGDVKVEEEEQP